MYPFIHFCGIAFGTYGILMATGMFVNYYILKADLRRRELDVQPLALVAAICGSGFVASKIYYALLSPSLYLAHPALLLTPRGFTFYGAVLGAMAVVVLLARRLRVSPLSIFDAVSAEAALGYGFGRVGCLLAGDGDYGTPTTLPWGMSFPHGIVPTFVPVHPTPIYEIAAAVAIAAFLWRLGRPELRRALAPGEVFAHYLIWTGLARFAVEFIRLNPRVFLGLSNAQLVAACSVVGGVALLAIAVRRRPDARLRRAVPPLDPCAAPRVRFELQKCHRG